MVWLKKIGSAGHTEVELPLDVAVLEVEKHLKLGGIVTKEDGTKIDLSEIGEDDKLILIPRIVGG
ncbi:hypothetical protein DRP05_02190 [Archaeoglobales archaeon]|nr:MAG: hypothetical protein DRP05_02190 [Archaeoglobales archaeon]